LCVLLKSLLFSRTSSRCPTSSKAKAKPKNLTQSPAEFEDCVYAVRHLWSVSRLYTISKSSYNECLKRGQGSICQVPDSSPDHLLLEISWRRSRNPCGGTAPVPLRWPGHEFHDSIRARFCISQAFYLHDRSTLLCWGGLCFPGGQPLHLEVLPGPGVISGAKIGALLAVKMLWFSIDR